MGPQADPEFHEWDRSAQPQASAPPNVYVLDVSSAGVFLLLYAFSHA